MKLKYEKQQKQKLQCISLEDPVNCEDSQQKRNNAGRQSANDNILALFICTGDFDAQHIYIYIYRHRMYT